MNIRRLAKVKRGVDAASVAVIVPRESLGFVVFAREADAMRVGGQPRDDRQMPCASRPLLPPGEQGQTHP